MDVAPNWLRLWADQHMLAGQASMQLAMSPELDWHIVATNYGTAGGLAWQKLAYPQVDLWIDWSAKA